MGQSPTDQLIQAVRDIPKNFADGATLGPQRRAIGKWIDDKEAAAKQWYDNEKGKVKKAIASYASSAPKRQRKQSKTKRSPVKR